eukprot:11400530-Alexandrium_andersonii.AAC.1
MTARRTGAKASTPPQHARTPTLYANIGTIAALGQITQATQPGTLSMRTCACNKQTQRCLASCLHRSSASDPSSPSRRPGPQALN